MFAVPSSDPPSTPDSRRDDDEHPSTTPAGPPPTGFTSQSFTPAGPPPPSVFGSSMFNESSNTFHGRSQPPRQGKQIFAVPSSPPHEEEEEEEESDEDMDAEGESMFEDYNDQPKHYPSTFPSAFRSVNDPPATRRESPRGLKRSRYGDVMGNSLRQSTGLRMEKDRRSAIPGIAKGMANKARAPTLNEADDLVLRTDKLMASLDADLKTGHGGQVDSLLTRTAQQLGQVWQKHTQSKSQSAAIGPKSQSNVDKANYLAQLLLRIHHPFSQSANPTPSFTRSTAMAHLVLASDKATTVPRALLDWLNTYHNPFPDDLKEVSQHNPTPVAHERFWDMIYGCTLRGDIVNAISLLETADWAQADSAIEDGYDEPGYTGNHLMAVREVVARCVDLLGTCPAVLDQDWDVKDADWAIFRNRTRRELQDLEAYAESDSQDKNPEFRPSAFGRSSMSFSTASRRAESKVPWAIYESLRTLYGQLLGKKDEIMVATQDWLEAVIFLTAWWDGEDDDVARDDLAASRRSMRQSQSIRQVDVSPIFAYKKQLLLAFAAVTDNPEEDEFHLNTLNPIHVGIACICEDDLQGVIGLLRSWSLPIAAAVVEVASAGGWLPVSSSLLDGFDEDDLMVLSSHGQNQNSDAIKRDDVLIQYSEALSKKENFVDAHGKPVKEGWDLACRVLARLDSLDTATRKISELLTQVPLDSTDRVDNILAVCNEIGLPEQARQIAERYADNLASTSQSYGSALMYYARAHSLKNLRSTVDLLISLCLVQSAAFPPAANLDPQLDALLNDQHATLNQLARMDVTAAQLIATYLSGYATLRRFYDLRDADAELAAREAEVQGRELQSKPEALRPLARKREAARALMAVIESAADSIRGGLFDVETESVVQVDALMTLLCESLPLMNQPKQILKTPHLLTLIRAVEDLQTVTPGIYSQTAALFSAAIQNFTSSPNDTLASSQDLAKSISGLGKSTAGLLGGGFAMVDSRGSLESEGSNNGMDGRDGSRMGIKRAWDWRAGAVHMKGRNVAPEDVLRVLRVQVASEMARVWM